ncbi:hypothetical protein SAMN05660464_0891 [Geodermatophilus dictyosporus]|uniref:Peptidase S9 n=1 Tax=Geodermatophilus dictyosporus TaxID=1523247 RepID=A0A1I5JNA1_9ACTN|nr:hypothetical protein [Geodermatophilus dictyosporus]SFO74215.1 hypothetical protein SAMN05660464_0891 [Geodermatophilus dictyosporus]
MIDTLTPSRAVAAVVTGVATAVHYATPDLVPSRTARGWTKAGITALAVAASVPELRATWADVREQQQREGEALPVEALRSLPVRSRVVVLASVGAVLAGSIGGIVLAERWAFRHGQARAAAGRRWPHTGPALLYGAVAGGLWFLPPPPAPR